MLHTHDNLGEALTIAEVCRQLRISPHTARYYERAGLIDVARTTSGHRLYDTETIRRLDFLIRMRTSGMGIKDLRRYVDLVRAGDATTAERLGIMVEHRDRIAARIRELEHTLEVTEHKIATYGGNADHGHLGAAQPPTIGADNTSNAHHRRGTLMTRTQLGTQDGAGLDVSAIGFGCMALSHVYGGTTDDEARATLGAAVDAGITLLDTADVYGKPREGAMGPAGTNEEMLAPFLAERRGEVQLATKFGINNDRTGADGSGKRTDGRPEYAHSACEASLRRLGVETIDLYYLHRPDADVPIEDTVGAMAELVAAGKVRHIGLSEVTADELRRANSVHPITAVQSEWSVWSRDVESHVVPACAELGVGFVPYSPLGRGFLTGTLTKEQVAGDFRGGTERMGAQWDTNQKALQILAEVADRHGASNAQVALAWLFARADELGVSAVPIPGSRKPERNVENLGAVDLSLSTEDMAALNSVRDAVQGTRNIVSNPTWISSGRE